MRAGAREPRVGRRDLQNPVFLNPTGRRRTASRSEAIAMRLAGPGSLR
jgi:hypothetical protein